MISASRWDRYLGMTAAMTQVPVPTAKHSEQRHRQDGSRHSFRNVCFVHKYLWSCKLYQAIESFLKIGCKGTNKS